MAESYITRKGGGGGAALPGTEITLVANEVIQKGALVSLTSSGQVKNFTTSEVVEMLNYANVNANTSSLIPSAPRSQFKAGVLDGSNNLIFVSYLHTVSTNSACRVLQYNPTTNTLTNYSNEVVLPRAQTWSGYTEQIIATNSARISNDSFLVHWVPFVSAFTSSIIDSWMRVLKLTGTSLNMIGSNISLGGWQPGNSSNNGTPGFAVVGNHLVASGSITGTIFARGFLINADGTLTNTFWQSNTGIFASSANTFTSLNVIPRRVTNDIFVLVAGMNQWYNGSNVSSNSNNWVLAYVFYRINANNTVSRMNPSTHYTLGQGSTATSFYSTGIESLTNPNNNNQHSVLIPTDSTTLTGVTITTTGTTTFTAESNSSVSAPAGTSLARYDENRLILTSNPNNNNPNSFIYFYNNTVVSLPIRNMFIQFQSTGVQPGGLFMFEDTNKHINSLTCSGSNIKHNKHRTINYNIIGIAQESKNQNENIKILSFEDGIKL